MTELVSETCPNAADPRFAHSASARLERMLRELECDPGTRLFAELLELPLPHCYRPDRGPG